MIKIQVDLCTGCGLCANICPQQAISIVNGQARLNQVLCNRCRVCLGACPQVAIVELAPVSKGKLSVTVGSLKQKTDDLIERIEKLRQKSDVK